MRIGVHAHPGKPLARQLATRTLERLQGAAEVVLTPETHDSLGRSEPAEPLDTMRADVLVAFGGDGTFLMSLQRTSIPLLAINTGTVGFLAEVEGHKPDQLDAALDRLLEGRYQLEERMKVGCQVGAESLPDAINEVVLHTDHVAKMRLFEVAIDGVPVGRVRADGMIVSTPTGSTSYALSAFGPIVDPSVEALIVTSLAPFQAPARGVVVDPLRTVRLTLVVPDRGGTVVVDGHTEAALAGGGHVTCYRSPRKAVFVRFSRHYFRQLRRTRILPWPERPSGEDSDEPDLPSPA